MNFHSCFSNLSLSLICGLSVFGSASAPASGSTKPPALALDDAPRAVALAGAFTELPLELYANKPVLAVRIDGRGPFRLFLDTGAGATVLDAGLVRELRLKKVGTTKIGDPASPEGLSADQVRVPRLEIGGVRLEEFFAVSFDRADLHRPGLSSEGAPRGVLGMPLFRTLQLTIDYPRQKVRISQEPLPETDGRSIVAFEVADGGTFSVPVRVGGVDRNMTVDSGSSGGLTFPEELRSELGLAAPAREIGRGRTVAGEAVVYGGTLAGAVELGEIRLENPDVRFFGRLREGNLGYAFLSHYAISIDQRNRRMRFVPGAAAETPSIRSPGSASLDALAMKADGLGRYAGLYGIRRVTVENGMLTLQRLSGPQGEGAKLTLREVAPLRFAPEGQTEARLEFVEGAAGEIVALRVQTPQGEWERAEKELRKTP
ncbi:MAG: aspartyl protease family protein [Thermoanaerobaculia bacterium]